MAPWAAMWLTLMMFLMEARSCAMRNGDSNDMSQGSAPLFLLLLAPFDLQGPRTV